LTLAFQIDSRPSIPDTPLVRPRRCCIVARPPLPAPPRTAMPSEELVRRILWVGVGGAGGAVARFFVASAALRWWGDSYPWGTTIANLLGSLLFGVVWAYSEQRADFAIAWRLLIMTGFLGSFTTFSTFMFESVKLFESERPALGLVNLGLQTFVGLVCVFVGLWLGRQLLPAR
jgi:fluoride exporter